MGYTAAQLLTDLELTIDKQQVWTEALILEKIGLNWDTVTYVAAGPNAIVFDQPYGVGVTDYEIWGKALTNDGQTDVGFVILDTNKTNVGFEVWVPKACIFAFTATQPKTSVPL